MCHLCYCCSELSQDYRRLEALWKLACLKSLQTKWIGLRAGNKAGEPPHKSAATCWESPGGSEVMGQHRVPRDELKDTVGGIYVTLTSQDCCQKQNSYSREGSDDGLGMGRTNMAKLQILFRLTYEV